MGTINVAGTDAGVNPSPPTISWKARFCEPATVGAMNVGFALFGLLMVTTGSPGLIICDQVNGPVAECWPCHQGSRSRLQTADLAWMRKLAGPRR